MVFVRAQWRRTDISVELINRRGFQRYRRRKTRFRTNLKCDYLKIYKKTKTRKKLE